MTGCETDRKNPFEPKWIAWEITRRCNLKCIHCRSASTLESMEGAFSTADAFALIDDIVTNYNPVMVLTGGEPLLRADVFDIAEYGTGRGLRMCLATNGTLVTPEICGKIKKAGVRMVSLSLDGSTRETHDDFRGQQGAFDGTINAARLFRENGIDFLVNSSFTKRNRHDVKNIYHLAKELGATAWYMFMLVPTGRGEEIMSELIPPEEYEKLLEWHYEMEQDENDMLVRPTCAPHYYRIILQKQKESGEKAKRRSLKFSTGGAKGCVAAQLICLIDNQGEVHPCSYFLSGSAGNVRQKPFKEIWDDSPLFNQLRDFKSYKGKCGACEYINVCGGCRARADAVFGDYLAEEPYCGYTPRRMAKK